MAIPVVGQVDPDAIRCQLARILAHPRFGQSLGLARFLRFTVEQTIEGRGDGLKETVLGVEVFGRGPDFDSRLDPIVRVQAAKLRARLKEYYAEDGAKDPLIIDLPKGGYSPVFRWRADRPETSAERVASSSPSPTPNRAQTSRRLWIWTWIGIAFAFAFGLVIGGWLLTSRQEVPPHPIRITADAGATTFPAISRDGNLIVYASDRSGNQNLDIWLQQSGSSEPLQLSRHPATDRTPDISPDGRLIVFRSERDGGGLYLVDIRRREERRLAGSGWQPRFSPDGNSIVFQDRGPGGGTAIYVLPVLDGERKLLVDSERLAVAGSPVFTPDGGRVLFVAAGEKTQLDVWSVRANGGDPQTVGLSQQLARQNLRLSAEALTVDCVGDEIVFSAKFGSSVNLFRAKLSPRFLVVSDSVRQITFGTSKEHLPRASAGGQIVFVSEISTTRLWKAGSALTRLTSDASLPSGSFLSPQRFSVRNHRLVFSSPRAGNPDVWARDLTTGEERSLASSADPEDQPAFSPDNAKLAWRLRRGGRFRLVAADSSGLATRELADDCETLFGWSADSTRIYCGSQTRGLVFSIGISSGHRETLYDDGARIVKHFEISPGGDSVLLTIRSTKHDENLLFSTIVQDHRIPPFREWAPLGGSVESEGHWSADGTAIYFYAKRDGHTCLWRWQIRGNPLGISREPVPVHHFHASQPAPWNRWISVTPEDVIISLTEVTANIWSVQLERSK